MKIYLDFNFPSQKNKNKSKKQKYTISLHSKKTNI